MCGCVNANKVFSRALLSGCRLATSCLVLMLHFLCRSYVGQRTASCRSLSNWKRVARGGLGGGVVDGTGMVTQARVNIG